MAAKWIVDFTKESGHRDPSKNSEYDPPEEDDDGIMRGPSVVFPYVPWREHGQYPPEEIPTSTVWTPCPEPGKQVHVYVLITNQAREGFNFTFSHDERLLGFIDYEPDRRLWVHSFLEDMTPNSHKAVRNLGKEYEDWKDSGVTKMTGVWPTTDPEAGTPLFVQIPLGPPQLGNRRQNRT